MNKKKQRRHKRHALTHQDDINSHSLVVDKQQKTPIELGCWQTLIQKINNFSEAHPIAYAFIILTVVSLIAIALSMTFGLLLIKRSNTTNTDNNYASVITDPQLVIQEPILALPNPFIQPHSDLLTPTEELTAETVSEEDVEPFNGPLSELVQYETTTGQSEQEEFVLSKDSSVSLEPLITKTLAEGDFTILTYQDHTIETQENLVKTITEDVCNNIRDKKFYNYNNPPFIKLSYSDKKGYYFFSSDKISNEEYYEKGRLIKEYKNIISEIEEREINKITSQMSSLDYDKDELSPSIHTAYEFLVYIIKIQIQSKGFQLMNGGNCGEYAPYIAFMMLRTFKKAQLTDTPSVAIINLKSPKDGQEHVVVAINADIKKLTIGMPFVSSRGLSKSFLCDVHQHQGEAFILGSEISNHLPYRVGYNIEFVRELGKTPDFSALPISMVNFLNATLNEKIMEDYLMSKTDKSKIVKIAEKLEDIIRLGDKDRRPESRLQKIRR